MSDAFPTIGSPCEFQYEDDDNPRAGRVVSFDDMTACVAEERFDEVIVGTHHVLHWIPRHSLWEPAAEGPYPPMMVCPHCKVERADYEGPNGAWLPKCPNCRSDAAPVPAMAP